MAAQMATQNPGLSPRGVGECRPVQVSGLSPRRGRPPSMLYDTPAEQATLLGGGDAAAALLAEGRAREPWGRSRVCAGVVCTSALAVTAAAAAAVLVFGVGVPARELPALGKQKDGGFLAQARGLMSPPASPPWAVWVPFPSNTTATSIANTTTSTATTITATTTTSTTTEGPDAILRKRLQIVKNPDGTVSVRVSNGEYITVTEEGSLSNVDGIGDWERFELIAHKDGTISLKAWTGSYIGAKDGRLRVSSKIGSAERLTMVQAEEGTIMLEASDGGYVSNDPISDDPGRFAVWTRKVARADEAAKFYVVVNPDDTVSLTCFHGTYLSVEDDASVVAASLTVGKEQKFKRHQNSDGTISLFAVHIGRYLTAHPNGTVSAKGKKLGKREKFHILEQNGTDGNKIPYSFKASDGTYLSVSKLPVYTYYMYRAQGNVDYPWRSVNTGNLAGVMWYLHNEVVQFKPRKFGIERIIRMKVQTTSTKELYKRGLNFGVRFAYDGGKCTGAGPINGYDSCKDLYARLGHFIGCNYLGDYPFPMAVKGFPSDYDHGVWYSLPKEGACDGVPTGEDNCTYSTEEAGEIFIGDLYGMGDNFWGWYGDPGSQEYVPEWDTGAGTDFWRGKGDMGANIRRVQRALDLFHEKYPNMTRGEDYPDPVCDFNCKRFYNDEELDRGVGAECLCSASPNARLFFPEVNWDQCGFDPLSGMKGAGFWPTR